MNNYLVPINRYQFSQFYRYGYTYIPKSTLFEFDGEFSETTKQNLANHFSFISPFEYDEEYLILHLSKVVETALDNIYCEVQEIVAIYPLSKQAKLSIQEKIDQRIKLSEPIFESVLPIIESAIQKKEIEKAIDALWQICDIEGNKNEFLNLIGIDNIFKGLDYRKKGIKASRIENGDYWSILIAYDRFDFFPNENIGYFYDAGQVFAHFNNKPTFEGSGLHSFLNGLKPKTIAKELLYQLENNSESQKYISKTYVDGLKRYLVAPLFLMLRDSLRNNDDIYNSALIKNLSFFKGFGKEFDAAIILLGAFFGYKKFYDLYYDKLNLRFYNSYNPKQEKISEQEIQLPIVEINENTKAEIEPQKEVVIDIAASSTNEVEQTAQTEISEETDVEKTLILEEASLDNKVSPIENIESTHHLEEQGESEKKDEINVIEKTKIEDEPNVEAEPLNEKNNDFNALVIDIIQTNGEMSIANLKKEINLKTGKKMTNDDVENIIKDIPEISKNKSTKKVKVISTGLFNT